jgi:hypothetical protein
VHWLNRSGGDYRETQSSSLIELDPQQLAQRIDWP